MRKMAFQPLNWNIYKICFHVRSPLCRNMQPAFTLNHFRLLLFSEWAATIQFVYLKTKSGSETDLLSAEFLTE